MIYKARKGRQGFYTVSNVRVDTRTKPAQWHISFKNFTSGHDRVCTYEDLGPNLKKLYLRSGKLSEFGRKEKRASFDSSPPLVVHEGAVNPDGSIQLERPPAEKTIDGSIQLERPPAKRQKTIDYNFLANPKLHADYLKKLNHDLSGFDREMASKELTLRKEEAMLRERRKQLEKARELFKKDKETGRKKVQANLFHEFVRIHNSTTEVEL